MERVCKGAGIAALLVMFTAAGQLRSQANFSVPSLPMIPDAPRGNGPPKKYMEHFPDKASLEPSFSIPVTPMGFSIPGTSYLLRRQQLVSLDFLDENTLLFSFHVASGLREREGDGDRESRQRIHAVVINVATGKAGAEADWAMPDRRRYLWVLNDGHFLLRTADGLERGDAELKTKEYMHWPGRLMWIAMDPQQKYLIANSIETENGDLPANADGRVTAAKLVSESNPTDKKEVLTIRTVRRDTGEVVKTTKAAWTSQTSDWPINSEGYVETVHDKGPHWVMKYQPHNGSKGWAVAEANSVCVPQGEFVTDSELLVTRCDPQDGWKLTAASTGLKTLWETHIGSNTMWPLLVTSRDGSRTARETLVLRRSAEKYTTGVRIEDVQGQMVRVYDTANGKAVMEAPIKPIYDGGGNVAVSPSGRRVAILNGDAIQVYDLPAPATSTGLHK